MKNLSVLLLSILSLTACRQGGSLRQELSLNGTWQIAKTGSITELPHSFNASIPVPGLVDMASPKIDTQDTTYENSVYWYRTTFSVNNKNSEVVNLKISKAKYHTRIYVNGNFAGENPYSFTPAIIDIKPYLNQGNQVNELLIAVGCKNNLPDSVTTGADFEKTKYIPGIYDDVKLIESGFPFISNVQTAPDIENEELRVVAELRTNGNVLNNKLFYTVSERITGKVVANGTVKPDFLNVSELYTVDFNIDMQGCQLWSPENPFLYDLELSTEGDQQSTRFGMRTFGVSADSGVFLLNGKPYYMRGTNVCIFRFFEDPDRNSLPWDRDWITLLHSRFKDMHWNSIRYCIGFPPEKWYEIADSIGFLIQDEYPLWSGGKGGFESSLEGVTSTGLANEYYQWMRERWNHPCVVIWDAQNESVNDTTGKAIQMVRKHDLSNRPWENGWAAPASEYDAIESHPYLFVRYFKIMPGENFLSDLMSKPQYPENGPDEHSPAADGKRYKNPVIINEYGWVWLNRNGTTTTLTDHIYPRVFPSADTPEKRLKEYAKILAMKTEYWRAHRKAAGVLHFCGLGYSRPEIPRGQTSDNFTNIKMLTFEPNFYEHVRPAFAPVGLMIDFWEQSVMIGQQLTIPIHLINDTYARVNDTVTLTLSKHNEIIAAYSAAFTLPAVAKTEVEIPVKMPGQAGHYLMKAEILYNGETLQSNREFTVK